MSKLRDKQIQKANSFIDAYLKVQGINGLGTLGTVEVNLIQGVQIYENPGIPGLFIEFRKLRPVGEYDIGTVSFWYWIDENNNLIKSPESKLTGRELADFHTKMKPVNL